MPNAYSGSTEQLLRRALELGLIDYYERRGEDCFYIEIASLQIELTEQQTRRWIEAALNTFLRMHKGQRKSSPSNGRRSSLE